MDPLHDSTLQPTHPDNVERPPVGNVDYQWPPFSSRPAPPLSGLIPEYSDEELEGFVRLTERALCEACRIMLGPESGWEATQNLGVWRSYAHHTSCEALSQSAGTGCPICVSIQHEVARRGRFSELYSSSDYLEFGWCRKSYRPNTDVVGQCDIFTNSESRSIIMLHVSNGMLCFAVAEGIQVLE